MQLKTGQKAWKISKRRFSQTVRKQFAAIANFAMCSQTIFALRNLIPQCTVALRNLPLTQPMRNFALRNSQPTMRKFRNTKFAMRKFRKANFAMRKFRKANFAMPKPISQCQSQFRNAKINFAMPKYCSCVTTYAKFLIAKFTTHFANFANPFRIAKFTAFCEIHICRPCHPL